MAYYEKWQSERYSIGCKVWEARCPNCHELVESADPISSNYRFCPCCGFDMKSDFQRVADRRQFTECLMKLREAKQLLKSAIDEWRIVCEWGNCGEYCGWFKNGKCTQEWSGKAEAMKLIGDEPDGI